MIRRVAVVVCIAAAVVVTTGTAASSSSRAFRPRVANALGLAPPPHSRLSYSRSSASGAFDRVTYHGGSVMSDGVTVHLIFWAPSGYAFSGSPGGGAPTYEGTIEKYFTDVAADSGPVSPSGCATPAGECNVFSTLAQYGSQSSSAVVSSGNYSINYSTGADVIEDTDSYPAQQCTSPKATAACILDSQLQTEVDHVASLNGNGRGLTNLWYVYTPPDVDECISPGICETNAYGGYHSLSNINGNGVTIYAYTGDPVVESQALLGPGTDPEGNPDAEVAVDIAAHETNEAMTDPTGLGWMDPNGYEVADKCEDGPETGTPLGTAANGSPYNQVINGDQWLTQEMWSNDGRQGNSNPSCVQGTTDTSTGLPVPQVNLTQFSSSVTGNIAHATAGVGVKVTLLRGSSRLAVAHASGTTDSSGAWSVTLARPVGDDRDEIDVDYSGTGAPTPHHQVILTGNGDDPVDEAGWTGWTWLDQGFALTNSDPATSSPSLSLGPCFQTGVESYTVGGVGGSESPTDYCGTASDVADTPLASPVTGSDAVTYSTNDNRAFQPPDAAVPNGAGGLVDMTVPVGEPDSVGAIDNGLFTTTGFPTCAANLGTHQVTCSGLVPSATYTLTEGKYTRDEDANDHGVVHTLGPESGSILPLKRGDTIVLANLASSLTLTTLHIAKLQVHIVGRGRTIKSGTCSPFEYWTGPLTIPPTSKLAGEPTSAAGGSALTGKVCPSSGKAAGFPTRVIAQTDDRSGGETITDVPNLASTFPRNGATEYGSFTARAQATRKSSAVAKLTISLKIERGRKVVARAENVDTAKGAKITALAPGHYTAVWTVTNRNGDTRIVTTKFIAGARR
jgi:hypothetical protein